MPFSTPGEEALGHGPADDALGELDAAARIRLDLEPDLAEHAVAAGLLLVAAMDRGLAADRLAVRDRRGAGDDRRAELALEPLDDHGDVRLAHRPQDLLAGVACARPGPSGPPRAGAGALGPSCRGRPSTAARSRPGSVGSGKSSGASGQRALARRERVAGLGHASLATAPISPAELADRLLLLAVESRSWPMRSSSSRVGFQTWACDCERAREDPEVGQPADERVGGRLEDLGHERPARSGGDVDLLPALSVRRERRLLGRARAGSG